MQNTDRKTNQRMPGRSANVVGNELGNGPVGATPSERPSTAPQPVVVKKPRSEDASHA